MLSENMKLDKKRQYEKEDAQEDKKKGGNIMWIINEIKKARKTET